MNFRNCLSLAGLAAALSTSQAMALSTDGQTGYYLGGFGAYELGDSQRDSDHGHGFQATVGRPIKDNSSLELSFMGVQRKRDVDGRKDYRNSLMLDYLRDFGSVQFQSALLPSFKPYLLSGGGAVLEDVRGSTKLHPALNVGGGVLVPLRVGNWNWGWGLRAEARALAQYNAKDSAPANEDFLVDFNVLIGLHIPLSFGGGAAAPLPAPDGCPVAVVDPVTGRSDCIADSDRDGVQDAADQCPDTAAGILVNEAGCAVTKDGDADGDAINDLDDLCPNTASGLAVDGRGCAVEQTVSLSSVTFETGSAVLTGQATTVLDGFARALSGQGNIKAEIAGHTDNLGSPALNLELSKQRAAAVRQYLIGKGIDGALLTSTGYGQDQPVASNDDEAGRAENRRVDFRLVLE